MKRNRIHYSYVFTIYVCTCSMFWNNRFMKMFMIMQSTIALFLWFCLKEHALTRKSNMESTSFTLQSRLSQSFLLWYYSIQKNSFETALLNRIINEFIFEPIKSFWNIATSYASKVRLANSQWIMTSFTILYDFGLSSIISISTSK